MPSSRPEDWADRVREGLFELEGDRSPASPPKDAPLRITRYDLREPLGEGATAVVYAAWDRELHRGVAVKVLREFMGLSAIARERFRREAQAAAGLSHPNLVTVYDAGEVTGQAYLVMERVDGRSLADVLRDRRPGEREFAVLLEAAARGVAAAHEKGIVHRDLKPGNILVTPSGDPKVGDFGMAHLMDSRVELTRTGVPLGTPLYMAPEQVQGRTQDITPRTDVYGLGAILYEGLVGRPPHIDDSVPVLYGKIAHEEPVPPRKVDPSVPAELEAIALKALDKDPARRYATAGRFADDLARYLEGRPIQARPASIGYRLYRRLRKHRWAAVAATVVVAAMLAIAVAGQRRARALERERLLEREAADERARSVARESEAAARAREESLKRLSHLWARMVAVQEWRKQPSRRIEEIRRELEALIGELSAYVRESPALPQGYYVRARAHFSSGDLAAAEADLTRALDREPDFTPGWALLAQLKMERYMNRLYAWSHRERLARRQESEPVLREAEEAMRRWASGKSSSDRWGLSWTREDTIHEILILALRERYVEGNREAAVERLKKAHSESPAAEFCDFLGNWAGEVEPAEKWLDQAIAIAPHWERPYLDRGVVRSVKKERERAIADFTRAIEINPNCVMAYDNRAVQRFHLGDLDRAIEDCTRALTLDPRLDSGLLHRAEAWCRKGEFRKAVQDCTEAIALRPAVPGPYGIRGFSLLQMGEFDRAAPDLERAIELEPEEPLHYLRRAFLFFARKDFARAARDCEKCLQLAPPEWEHRAVIQDLLEKARRS